VLNHSNVCELWSSTISAKLDSGKKEELK
jgi:hypothetical protein